MNFTQIYWEKPIFSDLFLQNSVHLRVTFGSQLSMQAAATAWRRFLIAQLGEYFDAALSSPPLGERLKH